MDNEKTQQNKEQGGSFVKEENQTTTRRRKIGTASGRKKRKEEDSVPSIHELLSKSDRDNLREEVFGGNKGRRNEVNCSSTSSNEDGKGSKSVSHGQPVSGDVGVCVSRNGKKTVVDNARETSGGVGEATQGRKAVDIGDLVHPDLFARGILGTKLYPWQERVLRRCEKNWCKVALCAANESGKTSTVIVPFVIWHATVFPGSLTVVTAKQERQIIHTFMGALKQYSQMLSQFSPDWKESELVLTFPDGRKSKIIGFTTNEGARFESFHNMPGAPLAIVVDECKEIDDDIFVAVDRCNPLRRLYASSPSNNPIGRFHSIVTENPEKYELEFVSAFDCPHISKKRIEDAERAYGKDSSIYRSMILGLPTEDNEDCIFSASAVDACMGELAPRWIKGAEVVFIDWSTGGDEIVVAHRNGNKVTIPLAFNADRNRVGSQKEILDKVEDCLKELKMNMTNKYIFADDDGIGWGFNNQLRERGWNVQLFRGGAKPARSAFYQNRITEIWYGAAGEARDLAVILPADKKLRFQLVGRKKRYDANNPTLIRMQPKAELPHSPDRGDAVIGCMMCGPDIPREVKKVNTVQYKSDDIDDFLLDIEQDLYIRKGLRGVDTGIY